MKKIALFAFALITITSLVAGEMKPDVYDFGRMLRRLEIEREKSTQALHVDSLQLHTDELNQITRTTPSTENLLKVMEGISTLDRDLKTVESISTKLIEDLLRLGQQATSYAIDDTRRSLLDQTYQHGLKAINVMARPTHISLNEVGINLFYPALTPRLLGLAETTIATYKTAEASLELTENAIRVCHNRTCSLYADQTSLVLAREKLLSKIRNSETRMKATLDQAIDCVEYLKSLQKNEMSRPIVEREFFAPMHSENFPTAIAELKDLNDHTASLRKQVVNVDIGLQQLESVLTLTSQSFESLQKLFEISSKSGSNELNEVNRAMADQEYQKYLCQVSTTGHYTGFVGEFPIVPEREIVSISYPELTLSSLCLEETNLTTKETAKVAADSTCGALLTYQTRVVLLNESKKALLLGKKMLETDIQTAEEKVSHILDQFGGTLAYLQFLGEGEKKRKARKSLT